MTAHCDNCGRVRDNCRRVFSRGPDDGPDDIPVAEVLCAECIAIEEMAGIQHVDTD